MLYTNWKNGNKLAECNDCNTTLIINPDDLIIFCKGCNSWGFTAKRKMSVVGAYTRLKDGEV